MPRRNAVSITEFQKRFDTEEKCREYLFQQRWGNGFVCPKCGETRHCRLSNGKVQCNGCHRQTSVTAGTIMHGSHAPLTKWFMAMYLVTQDKRGISAMSLQTMIGVTYKTAWYMLNRIRKAMSQRDDDYQLSGVIEFDDAFFGAPTVGKKRGRGTEKAKVFVALSLDELGNPQFLKMKVTADIKRASVKNFADTNFNQGATILSDGYRSYIPALSEYDHKPEKYDPDKGLLHWIHIIISNAKAFILGTYHGLPAKNLGLYLDEFCFRFSRRNFRENLFDRLALALASSRCAYAKG